MHNYGSLFIASAALVLAGCFTATLLASSETAETNTISSMEFTEESIRINEENLILETPDYELYGPVLRCYMIKREPVEEYPSLAEFDAKTWQVNRSYNIPKEFYYDILPENMHCLVEGICNLEANQEISSMFLIAVAATEVGWDADFAGDYNWFNWTPDAKNYQNFSSTDECIVYTGERFEKCFFNPEWHALYGDEVDDYFTIDEINSKYAINSDGTVNTYWGEVVGEIIGSFHEKYADWVINNDN